MTVEAMAWWDYQDAKLIAESAARGAHRDIVGGLWDEIGALQLEFLKKQGLTPGSRLLDIGCGSLRLGVRAAAYLDPGNYWGTDLHESLLRIGYDKEIAPAGLSERLPRANLVQDGEFAFPGVPRRFDFAMAQSVFTHLPFNHLRLCLANLARHLESEFKFSATFFIAPGEAWATPFKQAPLSFHTFPHRDPYHYTVEDLHYAARELPYDIDHIGDWNHPRNQKITLFHRLA